MPFRSSRGRAKQQETTMTNHNSLRRAPQENEPGAPQTTERSSTASGPPNANPAFGPYRDRRPNAPCVLDCGGVQQPPWTEPVSRVASRVAHSLNNALTAIEGNLAFLLEEVDDERLTRELLEIRSVCARTESLASQLLSISGSQWAEPGVVDLRQLIARMELGRFVSGNITLCTDLEVRSCPVWADAEHLEQALLCLVLNARDALAPKGTIRIGLDYLPGVCPDGETGKGWVQLEVADSGSGMDAATLARAMEPFYTTRSAVQDRGLGLAIVHGLMRRAKGSMRITSTPGAGTSVRVWLPAVDNVLQARPAHERPN
jgi:signal transduction histidine kinase